jgi:hypothetical protein
MKVDIIICPRAPSSVNTTDDGAPQVSSNLCVLEYAVSLSLNVDPSMTQSAVFCVKTPEPIKSA